MANGYAARFSNTLDDEPKLKKLIEILIRLSNSASGQEQQASQNFITYIMRAITQIIETKYGFLYSRNLTRIGHTSIDPKLTEFFEKYHQLYQQQQQRGELVDRNVSVFYSYRGFIATALILGLTLDNTMSSYSNMAKVDFYYTATSFALTIFIGSFLLTTYVPSRVIFNLTKQFFTNLFNLIQPQEVHAEHTIQPHLQHQQISAPIASDTQQILLIEQQVNQQQNETGFQAPISTPLLSWQQTANQSAAQNTRLEQPKNNEELENESDAIYIKKTQ